MTHVQHEVVVGHDDERRRDVDLAERVDDPDGRRAEVERTLTRFLDGPTVHDRIGERDSDLDCVRAGIHDGANDVAPLASEPAGDVRHEQLAAGLATGAQMRLEVHVNSPSRSATCAASLSPRPESVTSTVDPEGIDRPASRASQPSAWAGSSAGTMPSVAERSWNPASASSSVADS